MESKETNSSFIKKYFKNTQGDQIYPNVEEEKFSRKEFYNTTPPYIHSDYILLEKLGKGGFGQTFKAYNKRTEQYVALKFFNRENASKLPHADLEKIQQEKQIFEQISKLKNPSFLEFYGLYRDENCFVIEMEVGLANLSEKHKFRKKKNQMYTQAEFLYIVNELTQQFLILQANNIVHRDVKPQNIIFVKDKANKGFYKYKLADFGAASKCFSNCLLDKEPLFQFTKFYAAPEVLNEKCLKYDPYIADVYSFGKSLQEILNQELSIENHQYPIIKELIDLMLKENINERISFQGIADKIAKQNKSFPENEKLFNEEVLKEYTLHGNRPETKIKNYLKLSTLHQKLARFTEAEEMVKSSKEILDQNKYLYEYKDLKAKIDKHFGDIYFHQRKLEKSFNYYDSALQILLVLFPKGDSSINKIKDKIDLIGRLQEFEQTHHDELSFNSALGMAYYDFGNNDKAAKYLKKTIKFKKKHLVENYIDSQIEASYNNLGMILEKNGSFDEAIQLYEEELKYLFQTYGEKHVAVATTFTNLGKMYQKKGDIENSEFFYNESLRLKKELFGEDHEDNAIDYLNLGEFYLIAKRNLGLAEEYSKKAVKISEASENCKVLGYALHNLGLISYRKGEIIQAKQYFLKSMNVREILYSTHQDLSPTIQKLGEICLELGQYSEAEEYYFEAKKLLDTNNNYYSGINIFNLLCLNNLVVYFMKERGYYKEAERFCLKFLKKQTNKFGNIAAETLGNTKSHLASIYYLSQQTEKCEQAWFEVVSIAKKVSDQILESDAYYGLGLLYTAIEKFDKAKEFLEMSLSLRVLLNGEKSLLAAISFNGLGKLFFIKKQFKEAEEFCLKANDIYRHGKDIMTNERMVNEYNLILIYWESKEYEKIETYYENIKDFPNSLIYEQNSINQKIFKELSGYFRRLGNEEKALKYYNLII